MDIVKKKGSPHVPLKGMKKEWAGTEAVIRVTFAALSPSGKGREEDGNSHPDV